MIRRRYALLLFIALFAIASMVIAPKPAHAAGVVGCNFSNFVTAISTGGTVDFALSANCSMFVSPTPINISSNTTIQNTSGFSVTLTTSGIRRIFVVGAGVTFNLSNLTLTQSNGSAIEVTNTSATVNINNVIFSANGATGGGAISNAGTMTITNSQFNNNGAGGAGGAIGNGGTMTITNTTFTSNNAGWNGGAIANTGTLTVTGSTFTGNNAAAGTGIGGGAISIGGSVDIINSTFINNTSGIGQSLYVSTATPVDVSGSTFTNNNCAIVTGSFNDLGGNVRDAASTVCPGVVLVPISASAVCAGNNLNVTISAGNANFNITGISGPSLPLNNVGTGTHILTGPGTWDDVTVTELTGDLQSINLGDFTCPVVITVSTCNFASFQTAINNANLAGGAVIDFNMGAPCTITLGATLPINSNIILQNSSNFNIAISGNNIYRIFNLAAGISFSIDGLAGGGTGGITLRNGNGGGGGGGGAIRAISGGNIITIEDVAFVNNSATSSGGGGAILTGGTLSVTNSSFSGNSTNASGGAINTSGTTTITNSTFTSNNAGGLGGAVRTGGTTIITGSTFTNNTTGSSGAGIYIGGSVDIINTTFTDNSGPDNGGALTINTVTPVDISGSTFTNNNCLITTGSFNDLGGNLRDSSASGCVGAIIPVALVASAVCVEEDLHVTITDGNGNFNITGAFGTGLPVNNVGTGTYILNATAPGPNSWVGVIVTELTGDTESMPLGNFDCEHSQDITVEFASANGSATEAAGIGNVLLVTTTDTNNTAYPVTVDVAVVGGSADGADYTFTGVITIPAGTANNGVVSIASGIAVTDDNTLEADEILELELTGSLTATLGAQTTYTHTILNDETGRVHANPQTTSTNENVGVFNSRFQLTILGTAGAMPLSTDVQVDFTVMPVELAVPDLALEPEDFTTSSTDVYSFPAGTVDGAFVNVPVTIVDDAITEADEFFDIQLASVTNAILPAPADTTYRNRQTVRINANDPAGYTVTTAGLTDITEAGANTSFAIRLNSQPEGANVVDLDFVTTDATECLVSPSSFSFNSTNWSADQTITISPVDELLVDGNQPCAVMITRNITTTAPEYIAIGNPANVGITVNDNDAPATITIVGGNLQSTPVNTAFGVPLLVEVRNGLGQLVQGASVAFTPPGAGESASITTSPATTDVNGQASVTATANTVAGTYNVAVTSGAAPAVNFSLTNTAGAPANIAFVGQPTDDLAGVVITPPVTVSLTDAFGNGVAGQNITVNLNSGTGIMSGTLTQMTDASGIATFNDLSFNLAGTKDLRATAGVFSTVSNDFVISANTPTLIAFFPQQPTNAVAGATISPAVTVTMVDAYGNPIIGQNVTLTLSTGTGVLSGTLTRTTNVSGVATFNDLSINLAGVKNITATSGALSTVSSSFTITAGAPANIAFGQQPTDTVAGVGIAPNVSVSVTDALGNGISGQSVILSLSTGTGALSGTLLNFTDSAGVALFPGISINLIGSKNLTATSGALSVVSNAFLITAGAPANIAFGQQPTDAVAGATIAPAVTVSITDGFGNGVVGQNVTLNLSTGTGVLAGTLTQATNAGGVATFADLSVNLIGSKNITATAGALNTVSTPFTITSGAPASIGFFQQPTDAVAGTTIAPAVTVLLVDGLGNPVSGQNITLTLSTGTGVLFGTLIQATDGTGVATFADLSINLTGSKNITATAGALNAVSNAFTITAGAPANIAFGQQPTNAVANATIAPAVTVSITDGFGNGVVGQNVTLTLSNGTGVLAGTLTQATNAGGVATFADLSINLAGSKELTATAGALSVISDAFIINAGTATNIGFVQQPTDALAGATIAPAVTVLLTDTSGNPVIGQNVTIAINTGTGVLSGTLTRTTNVSGIATFNDLSINLAGIKNLNATSGALSVFSSNFTISPNTPAAIGFVQQPTDAVAGVAIAPNVTVVVVDGLGNGVAGQNVTMNLSTGTGALAGTLTQVTDGTGVATFNDLSVNLIGSKNITATSGALSVVSNAFTITSGAPANINFVQQPTNATAGATIAPAVTVVLTDALGNAVVGQNVTMTLTTGTGVLAGTVTQATGVSGVAIFNDLSINLVGIKNITATAGALNTVSTPFTISVGTASNIGFVQQPTDAVAGATIAPAVTVSITDGLGNGVPSQTVTMTLSTGTGTLGGTFTQFTDASGVATFNDLNINLAGVKNITATSGALNVVSNAFTITADAPAFMGFSQQPTDAVAGATIAPAVTVLVVDGFSNGVPGQNVTLTLSTGTGVLAGTLTQVTNASGVATFNDLSINLIGDKNLTASVGALTTNSLLFTISTGASANIAFGQQPTDAVAGATIAPAVTVSVTDGLGNGVAGQNVTLTLSTGTGALSGTLTQVTDGLGVATFNNLSINLIGSKNITATSGALNVVSNAFNITSGTATNIAFGQQPTDAVAGATIAPAVTVTLLDGLGNPVAGQNITLSLASGTGVLSGTLTQVTDGAGVATFADLSINLVGGKNITATAGALSVISNAFTITSGTASNIAFGQQPTDAVAGATIAPAVTVSVTDGLGNGVAGQSVTLTLTTGTGALSGTVTQVTDGTGVATFADLSINLAGGKNLTATSGALNVVSNAFTITSGTSSNIAFGQQPTDAVAGLAIAPAVTVTLLDGLGNPVAGQNITLSLASGTGVLSGTLTQVTDGAGVATFNDLSIDLVGAKTLLATSGALNTTSNIFTISAGAPTGLVLVSGTPQQAPTDGIFAAPLVVRVVDAFGNPVLGQTVTFTPMVGGGGQSASLSAPLTTNIFGETGVTATANSIVGAYTVEASFGAQIVTFALENLDPNMLAVSVACVDADLVVTIISGSGNFDITANYGPGMPLMNVPLGAYTFFGPETWLNITVTELGGDLEILPVGTVSCDATTGGGTGTTSVPAPQDPNALGCVLTSEVVAPGAPDNTYCRVLMRDGGVVSYSGAVPQNLVDLGVIFAVDVYRLNGGQAVTEFPDYTQICLSGAGRMFYLDARLSPRDIIEMPTENINGMTCAWIPATGTLVLTN